MSGSHDISISPRMSGSHDIADKIAESDDFNTNKDPLNMESFWNNLPQAGS